MLRLYGCEITGADVDRLVAALTARRTAASLEAAAAIRFGAAWELTADELGPDLRDALLDALDDPAPGLVELRVSLRQSARAGSRRHRLVRRIHNPQCRHCECLSDCWCKRSAWGRMLRWYISGRLHSSVSACVAPEDSV